MPYVSSPDPYCYPNSSVLKNIPSLKSHDLLEQFEARVTALRAEEPLPTGRFSMRHYQSIHHHLFQDVYAWAGKFRTVRLSKQDSMFCYPEHIESQMKNLFKELKQKQFLKALDKEDFATAATRFLSTLNAIHPFREGNGRTQLIFLALLGNNAGHPLNLNQLKPAQFLSAMIASFSGDEKPLNTVICSLL